jgi:hypothetical protein
VGPGLRKGKLRTDRAPGDFNPLEGAINIVDAMLVFACGLLVALAMYWNLDLGPVGERINLKQGRELPEFPPIREDLVESDQEGKVYEKLGTVYKDPETGQLFMLTDIVEE